MSGYDWLKTLKAGDEVIVSGGGVGSTRYIRTVDRATATQIVVEGRKYNRARGKRVGSSGWGTSCIVEATHERKAAINAAQLKSKSVNAIRDFSDKVYSVPDEVLIRVAEFIRSMEEK